MFYTYDDLRLKAISENATAEDRVRLVEWFQNECMCEWNGECFDMDDGLRLFPVYDIVYDEDGEIDSLVLVDGEIK